MKVEFGIDPANETIAIGFGELPCEAFTAKERVGFLDFTILFSLEEALDFAKAVTETVGACNERVAAIRRFETQ